jgi:hypothetical protein
VRIPQGGSRRYTVRPTWYLANGFLLRGDPRVQSDPQLFVQGPFTGRLVVRIVPAVDPASVKLLLGELRYSDPTTGLTTTHPVSIGPPFRPQQVEIPVIDPRHDQYSWSYRLLPPDGSSGQEFGPIVTNAKVLVVSEGDTMFLDVEVVLTGDLLAAEVLAVQLDVRAEPPPGERPWITSHLFEAGAATRTTLHLKLRADRPPVYQYQTTVITAGGDSIARTWGDHEGPVLGLSLDVLLQPDDG